MKKQVFAYLQTHWDREWYKPFEEYRIRLVRVLEDIFNKLTAGQINSFYLDGQTVALIDYLELYPEKETFVKNLIKEKKLFIGPFYALTDEFLVNGESLARNLLYGIKYSQKMGMSDFAGYLPDAFGHNACMPMLFELTDIKNALVWRGAGHEKSEFLWKFNNYQVRATLLVEGYFQDYLSKKTAAVRTAKNIEGFLDNISKYNLTENILLPIGADHLGCCDNLKQKISYLNKYLKNYEIKLSTLEEYFNTVTAACGENINTIEGELRDNSRNSILPSCFSSRVYLKQQNASAMWNLGKIAEPLGAICACVFGEKSFHNELQNAWHLLLQNHAHDSICGCSLDSVHRENEMRFEKIEQISQSVLNETLFALERKIKKDEFFALNLSNFKYSGVIRLISNKKLPLQKLRSFKAFPRSISYDIHNIPVQENYKTCYEYALLGKDLKPFALTPLQITPPEKTALKVLPNELENAIIRIKVNKNGSLDIKNKLNGLEFKNLHQIFDIADVGDSYNFSPVMGDKPLKAQFISSKIAQQGKVLCSLELKYTLKIPAGVIANGMKKSTRSKKLLKHDFKLVIELAENSPRLDFKLIFANKAKNHMLKLNFPLPKDITTTLSEDNFGAIKRAFSPEYELEKLLPAPKNVEVSLNTGALQRFVQTQGLCVLTKGLNEYEVYKNNLNITLMRGFGEIAQKSLLTRNTAAGPPLPTPGGQCLREFEQEYALLLTENIDEMFAQADFFYNPVVTMQGFGKKTVLPDLNLHHQSEGVYVHSVKEAQSKDGLIIKIFNYNDVEKKIHIDFGAKEVLETDLLENIVNKKNLADKAVALPPQSIKVFKLIF
ncbi:MAG: glycoside hydrolase family 38 C-terminal domain-containing protein [Candidatus Gastranaerophilales bacterium]|nr:glycoside hydrolase family 38 C-terminal domain-containing protein [Candidatus Gastranaerophilales bacterium]